MLVLNYPVIRGAEPTNPGLADRVRVTNHLHLKFGNHRLVKAIDLRANTVSADPTMMVLSQPVMRGADPT
jgi:hypothetical protein